MDASYKFDFFIHQHSPRNGEGTVHISGMPEAWRRMADQIQDNIAQSPGPDAVGLEGARAVPLATAPAMYRADSRRAPMLLCFGSTPIPDAEFAVHVSTGMDWETLNIVASPATWHRMLTALESNSTPVSVSPKPGGRPMHVEDTLFLSAPAIQQITNAASAVRKQNPLQISFSTGRYVPPFESRPAVFAWLSRLHAALPWLFLFFLAYCAYAILNYNG